MSEVKEIKPIKVEPVIEIDPNKIAVKVAYLEKTAMSLSKLMIDGINASAYFAIKRLLALITKDNNDFSATREALCKQCSVLDKDGKAKIVDNEYQLKESEKEKFTKELNELRNEDIIYDFKPISISKINDLPIDVYIAKFFKE